MTDATKKLIAKLKKAKQEYQDALEAHVDAEFALKRERDHILAEGKVEGKNADERKAKLDVMTEDAARRERTTYVRRKIAEIEYEYWMTVAELVANDEG